MRTSRKPYIKGPRQRRAIEALLRQDHVPVKDIGELIGALNGRQIVMELREQGFYGIIQTERFEAYDRDGRVCKPGRYYIPFQLKPFAEEVLKEYTASASANTEAARNELKSNSDHSQGVKE